MNFSIFAVSRPRPRVFSRLPTWNSVRSLASAEKVPTKFMSSLCLGLTYP